MPYGYEDYRIKNGLSPNTVIHEVRMLRTLLSFINRKYKKDIEPHEIRPIDIKEYLDEERKSGIMDSTVKRKIIYIRMWFDYLWQINKIQSDFMPKFRYAEQLNISKSKIKINYQQLLDIKTTLFNDHKLTLPNKIVFLFCMRGIRMRDFINIKSTDFEDVGETINLYIENQDGSLHVLEFSDEADIKIILEGIETSIFKGTPYFLSSKIKGEYTKFSTGTMKNIFAKLSAYTGQPISSEPLRFAYIHHLYSVENLKIEEIKGITGFTISRIMTILNESLERIEKVDYNSKRDIS